MYTLNIKDIKLTPAITEDKEFKGESMSEIVGEAADYIAVTFKDVYNPVSVRRLGRDAIKDEKGETEIQKRRADTAATLKKIDDQYKEDKAADAVLLDKLAVDMASIRKEEDARIEAINLEYRPKIAAATTDDERDQIVAEKELKFDEVYFEFNKKRDAAKNVMMSSVSDRGADKGEKVGA